MVFEEYLIITHKKFSGHVLPHEPLAHHTYYRIGGKARYVLVPFDLDDLLCILDYVHTTKTDYYILGQGSNVLIADEDYLGVVIRLNRFHRSWEIQNNVLYTGAGLLNSSALSMAAKLGWAGLEFLVGVPGSIGGAVVMNAGTHLGEVKNSVQAVDILRQGKLVHQPLVASDFSYRKSHFLQPLDIIYAVYWSVHVDSPVAIQAKIKELLAMRKEKQPIELPSCGSVFKNPYPRYAWQVLDELGLRGYQHHQVQFSPKHPNFIVNLGHAQAKDVQFLIQLAQQKALKNLNINLETEVLFFP